MYHKALLIYYGLAMFVLGTALFVIHPSPNHELAVWQNDVKHQIGRAFIQTIGDGPWFEDVTLVFEGVASFYDQSADATIAMLAHPESDEDIVNVFAGIYTVIAQAVNNQSSSIAYDSIQLPLPDAKFMSEEPIYNIVPYREIVKTIDAGRVAGASTSITPVNSPQKPWVTIQDNFTGQLYCLAVYNGTVNQYLGPCVSDEYY